MRSYSYILSAGSGADGHYIELLETRFKEVLKCLLTQVEVDEAWYRNAYRDVDDAVRSGEIQSGRQHYMVAGFYENRLPRAISVNERWYLEEYPDVASAIQYGAFLSATQHFERDGFKEGRLPSENWSLLGNPVRSLVDA